MTAPALPEPSSDELEALHADPLVLDDRDDLPTFVATVPLTNFVAVARNLRDEGRLDLVLPHATAEQITALFDLDAWRGDRVDVAKARAWLTEIVDAYSDSDHPRGALVELMMAMDPELWTMALLPGTAVMPLEADDADQRDQALDAVTNLATYETPDNNFVVAAPDNDLGRRVFHILNRVYADDLETGRTLVQSLRGALPGMLEEDLLRWRTGRLADLGFVPWDEAMKLLRPLDPRTLPSPPAAVTSAESPPLLTPLTPRSGLLRQVLAALPAARRGDVAREFTLLVNELMAAQRFEPGDSKLQERAFHQAEATVGLGLELLAVGQLGQLGESPEPSQRLTEHITQLGLRGIFRVGYGPLDKLRRAALALHREGRVSLTKIGSLLDRPWGPNLANLAAWYPELPLSADTTTVRPLRSLHDVARATQTIAEAASLAKLAFQGFQIDPVWVTRCDEPGRLTLGDLVRTALIHQLLPGSTGTFAPLTASDLDWARAKILVDGRISAAATQVLQDRCPEHFPALAEAILGRLAVELAALELDADGLPDLTRTGSLLTVQHVSVWLKTGLQAS